MQDISKRIGKVCFSHNGASTTQKKQRGLNLEPKLASEHAKIQRLIKHAIGRERGSTTPAHARFLRLTLPYAEGFGFYNPLLNRLKFKASQQLLWPQWRSS